MRRTFIVLTICSTHQFLFAQNPGGVTGATLWLKTDAGTSTTTNGSAVTSWTNQMGTGGNATTTVNSGYTSSAAAGPLFQNGANTLGMNFNPALNFLGSKWLDGAGNFSTANVFVVSKFPTAPSANGPTIIGFDRSTGTGGGLESSFYAYSTTYGYQAGRANGNYVEADLAYTIGAIPTVFEGRHVSASSCIATVNAGGTSTYVQLGATRPTPYTGKYRLGNTSDNMAAIESGVISEIVSFNTNLSATDRLKVQSYLALKYGITLGTIAASVNYTASDATVLWTGSATYQNNVAGIARDDASVLNQKQSRSVNTGLQIVMGNGNTISTENSVNTNNFSADKSALIWGDNAGSVTAWTATGAPSSRQIVARKWKIQETGTVSSVKVQVADNSGSNGLPTETMTVYLLTDADGDFSSGATETAMTLNGTNWEANIDLTNAASFFTFATMVPPTPGGVSGAGIWLKADAGVTTGATMTWADQSGNNRNAVQSTAARQPTVNSSLINFNPALVLDGTDDFMPLQNLAGLPTGAAAVEGFAVARNLNTAGGWNHIISYGGTGANSFFTLGKQTGTANAVTAFNASDAISSSLEYASGVTAMTNGKYTGTQGVISSFGTQRGTINFTGVKLTTAGNIGTDPTSALTTCWNGNIAESIIYPGNLTTTQVNQVNSYLAIKYGTTKAGNYLASNGMTVTWTSGGGYDNEIAGIGADALSELLQKQSASESASNTTGGNKILTIALGNSVAASNILNTNTFSADKTFLVWGSNAGATTLATALTVPAGSGFRMARVWKATETLTVGNTTFRVPLSLMDGGSRYLVINTSDATFASGNTFYPLTVSGSFLTAAVDLTSRANSSFFFTFAQTPQPGPGGVTANLMVWLKADNGTLNGGSPATQGQPVSTWQDQGSAANDFTTASAEGVVTGPPTWSELSANYNPGLSFNGTQGLHRTSNLYTNNSNLSIFNVHRNTSGGGTLIFANNSGDVPNPLQSTWGYNQWTLLASQVSVTGAGSTKTNLYGLTRANTGGTNYTLKAFFEGKQSGTLPVTTNFAVNNNKTTIGYRSHTNASLRSPHTDDINEVVVYNSELTALEQQRVNSYLAIKYGLTLDQSTPYNYIASNGTTVIWDASATTYKNDIAGIGMDDLSGLAQKQSASINASNIVSSKNILAIALGNFAATNAANGNTFAADKTFLVTGNNGATTAFGGTVTGAGGITHMNRIWLAKETATVGTTKFRVPISLFGSGTPYMYISNDGATFSNTDQQVAMTAVGDYYEASVDLTSRANTSFHFTFAELTALPVTLTLNMTASPATVTPTSALQYVVTLANTSANTAYNVKIKDQIPAGVNVGSVVPSIGTWDAATKIWTVPTLGPSPATATLTINTVVQ